jgi:hypothetical protein
MHVVRAIGRHEKPPLRAVQHLMSTKTRIWKMEKIRINALKVWGNFATMVITMNHDDVVGK